jgi:hypothetical protein
MTTEKPEGNRSGTAPLLYVASRASLPERSAMWRALRNDGWRIASTWIDEAGEGETASFADLWHRIEDEIRNSDGLILYAEREDFPLKGALVEVGIALGMRKPVAVVLAGPPFLETRTLRPVGSWLYHGRCSLFGTVQEAHAWIGSTK